MRAATEKRASKSKGAAKGKQAVKSKGKNTASRPAEWYIRDLHELRLGAGFNAARFAALADVVVDTLRKAEAGKPVTEVTAHKIVNALGKALGTNLPFDDYATNKPPSRPSRRPTRS